VIGRNEGKGGGHWLSFDMFIVDYYVEVCKKNMLTTWQDEDEPSIILSNSTLSN